MLSVVFGSAGKAIIGAHIVLLAWVASSCNRSLCRRKLGLFEDSERDWRACAQLLRKSSIDRAGTAECMQRCGSKPHGD